MNTNYDDEMLQQINENADLFGYVSQTMELEKKGNDYWAHCPLHTDLTPSLSFTPAKNSYYCFSCGKSGGIIGYLIDFEKMKFEDAVAEYEKRADTGVGRLIKNRELPILLRAKEILDGAKKGV